MMYRVAILGGFVSRFSLVFFPVFGFFNGFHWVFKQRFAAFCSLICMVFVTFGSFGSPRRLIFFHARDDENGHGKVAGSSFGGREMEKIDTDRL